MLSEQFLAEQVTSAWGMGRGTVLLGARDISTQGVNTACTYPKDQAKQSQSTPRQACFSVESPENTTTVGRKI